MQIGRVMKKSSIDSDSPKFRQTLSEDWAMLDFVDSISLFDLLFKRKPKNPI
tara:strand:+ start:1049 stop:1204 length:156 start_codon:yes stop_codon:yes gene_type:complete